VAPAPQQHQQLRAKEKTRNSNRRSNCTKETIQHTPTQTHAICLETLMLLSAHSSSLFFCSVPAPTARSRPSAMTLAPWHWAARKGRNASMPPQASTPGPALLFVNPKTNQEGRMRSECVVVPLSLLKRGLAGRQPSSPAFRM